MEDVRKRSELTTDRPQLSAGRATAGQLALEIVHDIRCPLEALGNLIYLTRQDTSNPEQVDMYMRLAEEQIATLTRVASQVLDFARLSDQPKAADLAELAEAALRIHQKTLLAKNIHLVKELSEPHLADVRSGQILQVVSNLLANALEALPHEGSVAIRVRRHDGHIHLTVSDNGTGIHPEHLARLFEPYFTTKGESGNGLGLSLSKRIVEEHGGNIRFRSSVHPHRHGTTFRVSLPTTTQKASANTPELQEFSEDDRAFG